MTLRELANLANVSVSTISKAFSFSKGVSEETREQIFKIAREHGCYEQFHKGRYFKKLIAVICPEIKSEVYHRLITYLESLIADMGATMILSLSNFSSSTEEALYSYHAYYQKVDGIILIGNYADLTEEYTIPTVRIGYSTTKSFNNVRTDAQAAMDETVKYLMDMGHRKIAFLGESLTSKKANRFNLAMKKYAMPIHEEYIINSEERFERGGYQAMEQVLNLKERPTAVVFGYDYMALGGMKCIKDHGLSVPDDISIIGMDNIQLLPYLDTPLTSISSHYKTQCEIAVDILQKKMKNIYHSETHVLEATLIKRETVKNLKE